MSQFLLYGVTGQNDWNPLLLSLGPLDGKQVFLRRDGGSGSDLTFVIWFLRMQLLLVVLLAAIISDD